jgi:hypothetical protein
MKGLPGTLDPVPASLPEPAHNPKINQYLLFYLFTSILVCVYTCMRTVNMYLKSLKFTKYFVDLAAKKARNSKKGFF